MAELSGAASRHYRILALDRNRTSGTEGEVALKDIEKDVLAFIQEGLGLAAGATSARVVSELQLIPPNDVSDSLTKANLSVMVFDDLSDLPVVLPILRRGTEHSRLWASVTPLTTACPEATIRAAILHAHDETRATPLYIAGVSSKAFGAPLQNPAVANSLQASSRRYQLSTTTTVRVTDRTHASSFRTSNFLGPTGRRPKSRGRHGIPLPAAVCLPPASHTPRTSMPLWRSVAPAHPGQSAPPPSHHDAPPPAATVTQPAGNGATTSGQPQRESTPIRDVHTGTHVPKPTDTQPVLQGGRARGYQGPSCARNAHHLGGHYEAAPGYACAQRRCTRRRNPVGGHGHDVHQVCSC